MAPAGCTMSGGNVFGFIKEIDSIELNRWLEDETKSFRIIDVRQMQEISHGTVAGAIPMPLATLPARMHELSREEELVFICRSGARSGQACQFLQQQGYDKVYNLRGGMIGWAHNSLPITLPQIA